MKESASKRERERERERARTALSCCELGWQRNTRSGGNQPSVAWLPPPKKEQEEEEDSATKEGRV